MSPVAWRPTGTGLATPRLDVREGYEEGNWLWTCTCGARGRPVGSEKLATQRGGFHMRRGHGLEPPT